jgi:HAMP domain-containing protein
MDLIGKIFIVVILIMSIVFMSLSLMVYATHRNWRELVVNTEASPSKPLGLREQLRTQKATNTRLQQEMETLRRTLQLERAARQQSLAVLETRANQQGSELDAKNETLATLRRQHDQAVTTMELAQTNLSELKKEVEGLRESVRRTQEDRDGQFGKVVAMRDRLNQLEGAERRLEQRNQQLTKEVAESARVLERYGLNRHTPLHGVPPKLDGEIKMVRGTDLVELSLGSDDGLRVGHKLDVYRSGGAYLGRVEVMYTDPDDSVARIVPEFRQGIIRKGDFVATRLLDDVRTTARVN